MKPDHEQERMPNRACEEEYPTINQTLQNTFMHRRGVKMSMSHLLFLLTGYTTQMCVYHRLQTNEGHSVLHMAR